MAFLLIQCFNFFFFLRDSYVMIVEMMTCLVSDIAKKVLFFKPNHRISLVGIFLVF